MNKKLRNILFIVLGPLVLGIFVYYMFLGIEYLSGKEFVKYLEDNSETKSLEEPFNFLIGEDDFENSKLILVGEIHGTNIPSQFDVEFFIHLYKNFNVRWYWAELDAIQAYYMNTFLENGDEQLLERILKNWVVAQGRNNLDYMNKYKELHRFYKQLPDEEKFKFIGIDKIQDWRLVTKLVNQLSSADNSLLQLEFSKESILSQLTERTSYLDSMELTDSSQFWLLKQIKDNISFYREKLPREEAMFENFRNNFSYYGLEKERSYGFFGLYHVFQYEVNGEKPLAALIRSSNLGLADKMISINFMMTDSKMVMKSNTLPRFLQDEGPYTKMGLSSDNIFVMYIYGIQDFKRMTPPNHKSLIKLNGKDSPYSNTMRLNKTIQLLPVTDVFKMTEEGKEYVQYTIFVRNSDWAEPMDN